MHLPDPDFPPLINGHAIVGVPDAFVTACRGVVDGDFGAADLVWSLATHRVDMALVLEPDVPGNRALEMGPLVVAALADSIGALMPPKTGVYLRWPDTILINGAEAGRIRIAMHPSDADAVPDWMVIGIELELQSTDQHHEPGDMEHQTTLFEEGGGDLDRSQILKSLSAHILTWINIWQDEGFPSVHSQFIGRVEGHSDPAMIGTGENRVHGKALGLSDDMELLVRSEDDGAIHNFAFKDCLVDLDAELMK